MLQVFRKFKCLPMIIGESVVQLDTDHHRWKTNRRIHTDTILNANKKKIENQNEKKQTKCSQTHTQFLLRKESVAKTQHTQPHTAHTLPITFIFTWLSECNNWHTHAHTQTQTVH